MTGSPKELHVKCQLSYVSSFGSSTKGSEINCYKAFLAVGPLLWNALPEVTCLTPTLVPDHNIPPFPVL